MPQALDRPTSAPDAITSATAAPSTATASATADTRTREQIQKDERLEYLKNESMLAYISVSRGYFEPTLWLVAFVSMVLTFWIGRMKGSLNRIAALAMLVPLPLAMGVYGSINAIRATFNVIGLSGTEPDPSSLYSAYTSALDATLHGALLSLPAFFVALGFAIVRCRREASATK